MIYFMEQSDKFKAVWQFQYTGIVNLPTIVRCAQSGPGRTEPCGGGMLEAGLQSGSRFQLLLVFQWTGFRQRSYRLLRY
uniref:Uncharacterized protein n=1 Tax=Rubinisphaera brasiliensis (strain ATCC 49424 / DSM 5305 / JCM 21570 / IAM 15109 / NBRC 103401 / IFAM 1448) TaxID=756272 RepID=F0SLW9_RUBBR|nr:hypothetical protein Plabr_2292 [Rubinisphaera brasiliensis DSM 5305]